MKISEYEYIRSRIYFYEFICLVLHIAAHSKSLSVLKRHNKNQNNNRFMKSNLIIF